MLFADTAQLGKLFQASIGLRPYW